MSKTRKIIATGAATAGLTLGAAAIASASGGNPAQTSNDPSVDATTGASEAVDPDQGASEADEAEAPGSDEAEAAESDETVDGVDHQFEGEEDGNNGDGVPDGIGADEPDEAAETISDANG